MQRPDLNASSSTTTLPPFRDFLLGAGQDKTTEGNDEVLQNTLTHKSPPGRLAETLRCPPFHGPYHVLTPPASCSSADPDTSHVLPSQSERTPQKPRFPAHTPPPHHAQVEFNSIAMGPALVIDVPSTQATPCTGNHARSSSIYRESGFGRAPSSSLVPQAGQISPGTNEFSSYVVNGQGILSGDAVREGLTPQQHYLGSTSSPSPTTARSDVLEGQYVHHYPHPSTKFKKNGQPRKRLELACNRCRDKKIKCQPQIGDCIQCQKAGSECAFASGKKPGGGRKPKNRSQQPLRLARNQSADLRHLSSPRRDASWPSVEPQSAKSENSSHFHIQHASDVKIPHFVQGDFRHWDQKYDSIQQSPRLSSAKSTTGVHASRFSPDTDPFMTDSASTMHFVYHFFVNIPETTLHVIPRNGFVEWMTHCKAKSSDEMSLLYAVLALGTLYSQRSDRDACLQSFKRIAEAGVHNLRHVFTLQYVHLNLLLSALHVFLGETAEARLRSSSALRAAYGMRLNMEHASGVAVQEVPYLEPQTVPECRRRTFWAVFAHESMYRHYVGDGRPAAGSLQCSLRLPCPDAQFESDLSSQMPIVHYGDDCKDLTSCPDWNPALFTVDILAMLDDVTASASIASAGRDDASDPEATYWKISRRLHVWVEKLNNTSMASKSHLRNLYVLYHLVCMMLHRHISLAYLDSTKLARNVQAARRHAIQLLEVVHTSFTDRRGTTLPWPLLSCPLLGFAIHTAIDIMTAAGPMTGVLDPENSQSGSHLSIPDMLRIGVKVLEELSQEVIIARDMVEQVSNRVESVLGESKRTPSSAQAWCIVKPMHSPYGIERDVMYGLRKDVLINSMGLGIGIEHENRLHVIHEKSVSTGV